MKSILKKQELLAICLSMLISVFLVAVVAYSTTVGSGITTNSATTTDTLYIGGFASTTGNVYLGMGSGSGDDSLYFDESGNLEYLRWDDTPGQFVISDDLVINGNASTTGAIYVSNDESDADDYIYFDIGKAEYLKWYDAKSRFDLSDDLNISGGVTSTFVWIGTGGTANNIDLSNDMYIEGDMELDGEGFISSARISTLNSTTTNIGTLTVFTDLSGTGFDNAFDDRLNATTTLDLDTLEVTNLSFGNATSTDTSGYIYVPVVKFKPSATPTAPTIGTCFMDDGPNERKVHCWDGSAWQPLWGTAN